MFRSLVPFLILFASVLLAFQDKLRDWIVGKSREKSKSELWSILPVGLAAVYGGYFGAGLSVMVLAVLGVTLRDSLTRLNALKQAISFSVNFAAAALFVYSGNIVWQAAVVIAAGAILGGIIGGRLAGRIKSSSLRWVVVVTGLIVAGVYLLRL